MINSHQYVCKNRKKENLLLNYPSNHMCVLILQLMLSLWLQKFEIGFPLYTQQIKYIQQLWCDHVRKTGVCKCRISECGKQKSAMDHVANCCRMVCKVRNAESLQAYRITTEGSHFASKGPKGDQYALHWGAYSYTTETLFLFSPRN